MKKLAIIFLFPFFVQSQTSNESAPLFVALYTVGESWDLDKEPQEQDFFGEHSAFLSTLRKNNTITIGARFDDVGMIVFRAKDLAAAKNLLFQDVALQNKLFEVEIHPFQPFYTGCLE